MARDRGLDAVEVLVIGGGIAGTCAAAAAAEAGASVALACAGPLFSGSSFYRGTWGIGLIGPESEDDEEDLEATIIEVGGGTAEKDLVCALVKGIRPGLTWLEAAGVELLKPQSPDEQSYIPCFDHKTRLWRGVTRAGYTHAMRSRLEKTGVHVLVNSELMDIAEEECAGGQRVAGAILFERKNGAFVRLGCRALVLATGGFGGLFERRLTAPSVFGTAGALALRHGCALVNLEFMQMMPGLVSPKRGLVANEKAFRYARLEDWQEVQGLLEKRSEHGPFSARFDDRKVDLVIDAAGPDGLPLSYELPDTLPEFMRTYFIWLRDNEHVDPEAKMHVALFAHAANGGIRIRKDASSALPGLFACGEVTGGMHGADRLGGMSSANGLVFGLQAGRSAALFALSEASWHGQHSGYREDTTTAWGSGLEAVAHRANSARLRRDVGIMPLQMRFAPSFLRRRHASKVAGGIAAELQQLMSEYCMVRRSEFGLSFALNRIGGLAERLKETARPSENGRAIATTLRVDLQLTLARAVVLAMRARPESRGSHYRVDAPQENPIFARAHEVRLETDGLAVYDV